MRMLVTILAVGAFGGCATPQMTAVDLDAHARRNMLEAQQALADRLMIVSGVVQSTSLATRDEVTINRASYRSATAVRNQSQIPVVVLQPGSVFCFFEAYNIEDAASLKPGDTVSFKCHFDSVRPAVSGPQSVLSNCGRSDRW